RSLREGLAAWPSTSTQPSSTRACSLERESSWCRSARKRSRRTPLASSGTRWTTRSPMQRLTPGRRRRLRVGASQPDFGPDVTPVAHDDVHDRPLEEVGGAVDLVGDPAAVQLPALLQILLEHLEEVVLLDALVDLLLVVEGDVGGDGASQPDGFGLLFFAWHDGLGCDVRFRV